MILFHTSPTEIKAGTINDDGILGECLCFSADIYQMCPGKVITYEIEIDEDDIIEANSFFYRDDYKKLDIIIKNIMEYAECDEEQAQEYLSQRDSHGDGEVDWRIQGYTGEAAKALGYRAAQAEDEQGQVYIIPMLNNESLLTLHESE